jgi:ankyrin repeat protein
MVARELLIAAQDGDCDKLRELLDGGGASVVNERTEGMDDDREGEKFWSTALLQAVTYGQHAAVELLLEHNANPNLEASDGATPLMEAAATAGLLRILQTLLDRKDIAIDAVQPETGCTAFHYACTKGQADCAVELARRGCDMTLRAKTGETGKQLAERMKHTAVLDGLRALVVEQLRARQQLATAMAALCIAARKGECDIMRELLDGGGAAVVDERTEVTEMGKKFWLTALHQAVIYDQHAAVELLLEHNANPNVLTSNGATPLMEAACGAHLTILRTLLDYDAIIDAVNTNQGLTAFHYACFEGHADCAVELARRGCDMTLRTKHGMTGKDIAEREKHTAVLDGLRSLVAEQLRAKQQSSDAADDRQEGLSPAVTIVDQLRIAAGKGDCGKLRELLDGGGASAVNERTEIADEKGKQVQVTALIQAVKCDQHAAVDLLLEHGAEPNLPTSLSATPLMTAAAHGHLRILQTLLDREATAINAVTSPVTSAGLLTSDCTAFHVACCLGEADCAVELVRHGCDTNLQDTNGQTGWDMAKQEGHDVLIRRCKSARKLAMRKAQQRDSSNTSPASAAAADCLPKTDEDTEQQQKAAKKAAANRKKKDRKRAKKAAAQQQLVSQPEPDQSHVQLQPELPSEPEPEAPESPAQQAEAEAGAEPEPEEVEQEPEPERDERTQQLQALTELGVQQWSVAQVLEWVALADLSPEGASVVSAALETLDLDGDELLDLPPKILRKHIRKHGARDAEALTKQVIEQRDALTPAAEDSSAASAVDVVSERPESECPECLVCMESFCDDQSGQHVPRILSNCGHTVCHGCINDMLALVPIGNKKNKKKNGSAKDCKCPSCSKVTEVEGGDASSLHRNYSLL